MQIEITSEYLASQGLSKTFPKRFWERVDKNGTVPPHRPDLGPCWRWTGNKGGWKRAYGYVARNKPGKGQEIAHRASWLLHCGPIPDGLYVLHKCDNPECANPDHLFLGTAKQNTHDMMQKGRMSVGNHAGEHNGRATTTAEIVAQIRSIYVPGQVTKRQLAKQFGLSWGVIKCIVEHKTWLNTKADHSTST